IYQDNGVPVGGASVAVTLSDNKYVYGAGANLIGPGSAHILMVSGRELYFDAYSAAPRVLSFPAPPTTERHGYLNVVADIDWQARLLALRWGLQPVVSSTQSAPTFVRFARTSTDEGALAGSFYGVMRFGGAQVTVGSAKERRLFFVASRLARGVL
ncbi:MAG: hypothetical protein KC503_06435, partial [Myxococcales bacterium]|nr:hypothetical protein [Myxococcales bacterium]